MQRSTTALLTYFRHGYDLVKKILIRLQRKKRKELLWQGVKPVIFQSTARGTNYDTKKSTLSRVLMASHSYTPPCSVSQRRLCGIMKFQYFSTVLYFIVRRVE